MWNVGTVAQVCEIHACNNSLLLSFGRAWCFCNSHAVTSCQSKVFFYRGNIKSFLFLSKDCTPNILSEHFPGRGAMPCIATFPERKVDWVTWWDTQLSKKRPPCIHLHPFALFFHMSFFPSHHNMTLSHIPEDTCSWKPVMIWLKIESREKKFYFYNLLLLLGIMGLLSQGLWKGLILCTQSFYFVLKRGWALAGVLRRRAYSREFPSPFSKILCTRTHKSLCTHGAFLQTMMHSWFKCTPTDIHIKDPCVQKHMRSFPLEQNIFLS